MKQSSLLKWTLLLAAVAQNCSTTVRAEDWKEKAISPVANPLFFEDPAINSEIRPLFLYHNIDKDFITQGGDVRVYALEARWAATKRLAIIATKDGYIDFNPKAGLPHKEGWADIGFGLKYALVDNEEQQFLLTPGLKFEVPTGNKRVFQGNGKGEWDAFLSSEKGFGNAHVTGSLGFRVPNDMGAETASTHYSLQLDYYTCQYFIPFVVGNGFTVMSKGDALPLNVEGYDLINFGSSNAEGRTQVTLGSGFRSRLTKSVDVGFAYEFGLTKPKGLFGDRYTVDLIWRF